jgi:hypothetical protein
MNSNLNRKRKRQQARQSYYGALTAKEIKISNLNMILQKHRSLIKIQCIVDKYIQYKGGDLANFQPHLIREQVIYIIYNMKDDLRYVGQTSKDAIHRFMEHIQQAKRQSNSLEYNQAMKQKLLYTHMIKIGLDNWRIYPLEHIPATDSGMFKKLANSRVRLDNTFQHVQTKWSEYDTPASNG